GSRPVAAMLFEGAGTEPEPDRRIGRPKVARRTGRGRIFHHFLHRIAEGRRGLSARFGRNGEVGSAGGSGCFERREIVAPARSAAEQAEIAALHETERLVDEALGAASFGGGF